MDAVHITSMIGVHDRSIKTRRYLHTRTSEAGITAGPFVSTWLPTGTSSSRTSVGTGAAAAPSLGAGGWEKRECERLAAGSSSGVADRTET